LSYVRPPNREVNGNTQVFDGARSTVDLRAAYALARRAAEITPLPSAPGHVLVWVSGGSFAVEHLPATVGSYAVAGRHTMCDRILERDELVSLRHVLIRSVARPGGGVALRVLDLHTPTRFELADGSTHDSVFAEGPVAVGVGMHALVALPSHGPWPAELPVPHVVKSDSGPDVAAARPPAPADDPPTGPDAPLGPYRAAGRRALMVSRITLLPRAVAAGEPLSPSLARLVGGQHAITLEREGRTATLSLSREDLDRGVLIGRSEKCVSEELRRITAIGTSRVHLLITREEGEVVVYDLASTQGTWMGSRRVRREVLGAFASLVLGSTHDAVKLYWRAG
jgi:hypothetical protein